MSSHLLGKPFQKLGRKGREVRCECFVKLRSPLGRHAFQFQVHECILRLVGFLTHCLYRLLCQLNCINHLFAFSPGSHHESWEDRTAWLVQGGRKCRLLIGVEVRYARSWGVGRNRPWLDG